MIYSSTGRKFLPYVTTVILIVSCQQKSPPNSNNSTAKSSLHPNYLLTKSSDGTSDELKLFRDFLQKDSLIATLHTSGIPDVYNRYLMSLDSNFSMANEGEPWQVGCSPPIHIVTDSSRSEVDPKTGDTILTAKIESIDVTNKKLEYFGYNDDMAVLIYQAGGIGLSTNVIFFRWKNGYIQSHWLGYVGMKIQSQSDLLRAISQGLIYKKDASHLI